MNILLSSYSVNPKNGSEDGIGWHWTIECAKHFNSPKDKIYLVTKKANAKDTKYGIEKLGLKNVELVIVDTPYWLNWFREHNSAFHHIYYILWQRVAYNWAKRSGIKFDIIHHVTMGDFRITGNMYKFKNAYTIFGPVGGGQSTPKSLKKYEKYPAIEKIREIINKSRAISPSYKRKINRFDKVYAINRETDTIISDAMNKPCERLFELALSDEFKNLSIPEKNHDSVEIVFVGRLIEKKGLMLLLDVINSLPEDLNFTLKIYGSGGLEEKIKEYINTNDLNNKIVMCGNIDHSLVSQAYINADIFVMPSLRETSGNVIIEAMAHKLPVVALDMSISNDLKQYSCGEFINVNQSKENIIKEFADKLTYLIKNPQARSEYGENGYHYVNTNMSWENKFNTIYNNIKE